MKIYLSNPALICAAGKNPREFFESLINGNQKGIKKVHCDIAGPEVDADFYAGKIDDSLLKPTGDQYDMRLLQILEAALEELSPSVEKAVEKYGANRIGTCLGSCDNGSELSLKGHKTFFETGTFPKDYSLTVQSADYPALYTSRRFGLKGISLAFSTACSSSASAIIKARELIISGLCDAVIAGGVDIASSTVLLGFNSLEAVSHEITNPFSANRHGITLGEGASFFLLSKDDLDQTGIILAGTGESADASHMTAPLADGSGAAQAMLQALSEAGLNPDQIDYVNLHGTGTKLNDSMEGKAACKIFGNLKVPMSSTKPMTGHTLGAAGSLELAACFLAIKNQQLPLHLWDGVQDPDIPSLNLVKSPKPEGTIRTAMSNSFAFGGCNASLIISTEEAFNENN